MLNPSPPQAGPEIAVDRALSDAQIRATFPLMRQLRPGLDEAGYLDRVRRMQFTCGFKLACLSRGGAPKAVAGYRISESLAWGRFLYLDDLVTAEGERSQGYGSVLLSWLEQEGRDNGCLELHLDSGTQRLGAHRFYLGQRMDIVFFHFKKSL